ncbi:uncharacterized protein LOC109838614 [Asparagus officinalis]|uniref:uncharacterized protein LOC109838614 n=1 Tax=Asparagus officinalis TaxID=4686 RepID=UPI00098E1C70|nr:uncharacterized protein LOC109838614 [Asparagus officinalis]
MEYLLRRLNILKNDKLFKYHPKCSKLNITHLFFADDLLLFGKADIYSVAKLYGCLQEFSQVFGLEVNPNKCSVYLSGIDENLKQQICTLLNFSEGVLLVRYLGMPLISKRLSSLECSPMINKITDQFQSWQKRKNLSYAGRLQLIKSVIFGVQIFWTSNYILPMKILEKIDRLCSNFLSNHKIHLVSWETICKDKKQGGIGVFSVRNWNLAAATKLQWLIHLKKDLLWIKWVHENYLKQHNIWHVQVRVSNSWMWKQLLKVRDILIGKFGNVSNMQNAISKCCSGGKVFISSIYREIAQHTPEVNWSDTVWDSWNYPQTFLCPVASYSCKAINQRQVMSYGDTGHKYMCLVFKSEQ